MNLFSRESEIQIRTIIKFQVNKDKYKAVSSWTRAAFLFGRCSSGICAQLFTSYQILDYKQLNYFALASLSVATIISLFLPSVPKSIYFHRNIVNLDSEKQSGANAAKASKILIWDNIFFKLSVSADIS